MPAPPVPPTSLMGLVRPLPAGEHVVAAAFLGAEPALALADGSVALGTDGRRVAAHSDALLVAALAGERLMTGGADGCVALTGADGAVEVLAEEGAGRWIDAVAAGPNGALAWSAGKAVAARDGKGAVRRLAAPSSAQGLAWFPKGHRLAVARYGGATLWFPGPDASQSLAWKGSHLDASLSPDGRFLVTSMGENGLHGWRLSDAKDMRMTGYPGKSRSLSWSHDGRWLATSGAEAVIVWPFTDKDGPMGKPPRECGVRPARVSRAAFHPRQLVVAAGYEDGFVMLCRLTDAAELPVRAPKEGEDRSAVTALAWDAAGGRLLFGTAGGSAGLLALPP